MSFKRKILRFVKNKYLLTSTIFLLWIIFFDRNNLVDRFRKLNELDQLEKDRIYFKQWIENDKKRMNELETSNDNLEKFAREEYFMKAENEDIFLIIEED